VTSSSTTLSPVSAPVKSKVSKAFAAVIMAAVFTHFAERLLGVRVEIFSGGIGYFSFAWVLVMFVIPFIAGMIVTGVYGYGGKWLSLIAPVIVRCISYYESSHWLVIMPGEHLIPLGWWGFFVILTLDMALVGGFIGELSIRKVYSRAPVQGIEDAVPTSTSVDVKN
jgi:hypothetical protein